MGAFIVVSNKSSLDKTEIIAIVDDSHVFTENERMKTWLENGNPFESWKRKFTLVNVTDKDPKELSYLLEKKNDEQNKWHFIEPDQGSGMWLELYHNGEVSREFSVVSDYLVSR